MPPRTPPACASTFERRRVVALATDSTTSIARVGRLIFDPEQPRPVLLLGAGASVKSGVPLADDLAALAARHSFCREHGLSDDDPSVKRSDWFPWLIKTCAWFEPETSLAEQYPRMVERMLQPREEHRQFFLNKITPHVPRSSGYGALARMVAAGWLRTLLTVNFDHLIHDACRAEPRPRRIDWIQTPSEAHLISTASPYPQIIHLHGSVAHYTDQNLEEETQRLDSDLKLRLRPLLRDRPLIVLGYRGSEPSIMRDLLMDGADECSHYRNGIFWCARNSARDALHPLVQDLAELIGGNLQLVPVPGFDECMGEWLLQSKNEVHPETSATEAIPFDVPDLMPETDLTLDDLDLQLAGRTLVAYADRLGKQAPKNPRNVSITERLRDPELDLATEVDGKVVPTRAARLLFGVCAELALELRVFGELEPQLIDGNLFSVLDRALDAIAEFNQPFTLKGYSSETVRPYPALAFKELVVNALVHRDYSQPGPVLIEVEPGSVRFTNAGGLVGGLDPKRLGEPNEKAYRNPVMADLLYGTGTMDKEGSGLADVRRWARENGGSASFGPSEDNSSFVAVLESRPEQPDLATETAAPTENLESFLANVLSVRLIRDHVHLARTKDGISSRKHVWALEPERSFPPFALHEGLLITFSDLREDANPLRRAIDGDPEEHAVAEFFDGPDRERLLVQILNSSLIKHARSRGIHVSKKGSLYYPRTDDGAREITYRARARHATRTVTKPIISRADAKRIRYWEHEALAFRFRRFGEEWALLLVPGWLFTRDGGHNFLRGPSVSRLATRRSARNFNPQVTNDIVFWLRTLIGDADEVLLDDDSRAVAISGRLLSADLLAAPPAPGLGEQGDDRDTIESLRAALEEAAHEADALDESEDDDEEPRE